MTIFYKDATPTALKFSGMTVCSEGVYARRIGIVSHAPLLQRLQPHLAAGDLHELRDIVRDIEARIARFEQLKKP